MHVIFRVSKQGDIRDYINKPVLNKVENKMDIDELGNIVWNSHAIGTIVDAVEVDEQYELTIDIWDKFVDEIREYNNGVLDAISINFK